jgi:hypothetical protein
MNAVKNSMDNNPADNGEAQNPVENDVGVVQNEIPDFSKRLESILWAEPQSIGNSEPMAQSEEVQTEDKEAEAEGSLDGANQVAESDPTAEDGNQVPSDEEVENAETEVKSEGFQKRIDKLTYMRKQAEEQVQKLTEEVNSYKTRLEQVDSLQSRPAPTADNPFSDLIDEAKIKAEYETARELRFKCEENPEGFVLGEKEFSHDEVRQMRLNAMKAMEVHLPKQLQFVKAKTEFDKIASEQYPWFSKPDSQEYKLAQETLNNFKNFKAYPDYKLFVGDYVQGFMARTAKSIKKSQPARAVPSMGVKPTSSPVISSKVDATARNIEARYAKSQNRDDLKKAVSRFL